MEKVSNSRPISLTIAESNALYDSIRELNRGKSGSNRIIVTYELFRYEIICEKLMQ